MNRFVRIQKRVIFMTSDFRSNLNKFELLIAGCIKFKLFENSNFEKEKL